MGSRSVACFVRHCRYVAESAIEDYHVCPLHDAPQVRRLLEEGQAPAAYLDRGGRPIVLPCGVLAESDFKEHSTTGLMRAEEDEAFAESMRHMTHSLTHPYFDLTREMP